MKHSGDAHTYQLLSLFIFSSLGGSFW